MGIKEKYFKIQTILEYLDVIKSQFYPNMPRYEADHLLLHAKSVVQEFKEIWTSGSDSDS